MNKLPGLLLLLVLVLLSGVVYGQSKIYWVDQGNDRLQRANTDGTEVENLVTGQTSPCFVALDINAGKMYWTDGSAGTIQRSNLDGSSVESLVTGLSGPHGIALDVEGGKMYWVDRYANKVQRADLDGSNGEDLVTSGVADLKDIALDVAAGKMYWTNDNAAKIQRANLDGSDVEDLYTTSSWHLEGMDLDVVNGKMYWVDEQDGDIHRANLDGSSVENLITEGIQYPLDIALDVTAGKMYWGDTGSDKIQRANLDGSNIEDIVTSGLVTPYGITLAPVIELTNAFIYQGRLSDGGAPAEGEYDLRFKLYNDPDAGSRIGTIVKVENQQITNGLFQVKLDFGGTAYDGYGRWLEIGIRPGELADPNDYTTLQPRQEVAATPYAVHAKIAAAVEGGIGIDGAGTANYLPKFTDETNLENSVVYDTGDKIGVGIDSPISKLHVYGGSITQWDSGPTVGWGKTSVYTDSGTLDASGDFSVSIPSSLYSTWQADNYIFKVEVFVSVDPTSVYPHGHIGSAYSMALVGKQRGDGLAHFNEVITWSNDAVITFAYSSPVSNYLQIDVNTNRPSGRPYRVTVKISH